MNRTSIWRHLLWLGLGLLLPGRVAVGAEGPSIELPCRPLPTDRPGRSHLGNGGVLALDSEATFVSRDGGKTWSGPRPLFPDGRKVKVSDERALRRTRSGILIAAFMNPYEEHWTWEDMRHERRAPACPPT